MSDHYRITDMSPDEAPHGVTTVGLLRPVLWAVLLITAAANVIASTLGLDAWIASGFGLITLVAITALVVHHYRHRQP